MLIKLYVIFDEEYVHRSADLSTDPRQTSAEWTIPRKRQFAPDDADPTCISLPIFNFDFHKFYL